MTQSPTTRSKARYRRAAIVLAPLPLNAAERSALDALIRHRGCSAAALVRSLLTEAAARLAPEILGQPDTHAAR